MSKEIRAHLALLGANLIYGASFTVAKEAMPQFIGPYAFILVRVMVAVVMFWILWGIAIREKVARKDFFLLAACGVFGVAINQLFFFKGLSITTPINAAIIMTCNPVVVMLFSLWLLKESITAKKALGLIIGISGAALLITAGAELSFSSQTFQGDLFILLNASSYALYLVIVKPLMRKYHPVTIIKWIFTFGLLYVLPFGLPDLLEVDWSVFTPKIWAAVAFVVVFTTFLAYLLNAAGLKELSPTVVSYYIYLQPFLAALVAVYFGKDELTWLKIGAASLIFIGVFLVSSGNRSQKIAPSLDK